MPAEKLSLETYKNIQRSILLFNYKDWKTEVDKFSEDTNQKEWVYDNLFLHTLQLKCTEYRIIDLKYDNYLSEEKNLTKRSLYLKSREFVHLLEQDSSFQKLKDYLNKEINTKETQLLIENSIKEIDKYKWSSTISNILVYDNGYTFRVRYSDYSNRETKFQIDINFKDDTDQQIDMIEIKQKEQLSEELKSRREYNNKIKQGELPPPSLPPPLPKEKKKKKN